MKLVKLEDLKKDQVYCIYHRSEYYTEIAVFTPRQHIPVDPSVNTPISVFTHHLGRMVGDTYVYKETPAENFETDSTISQANDFARISIYYELDEEERVLAVMEIL